MSKLVMSVSEAAEQLGVSSRTAYTLAQRADFPAFHVSENRIVVSVAGLDEWVQKQLQAKGFSAG